MNHHVIKTIGSQSVSHSVIHSIKISLINYSRERERLRDSGNVCLYFAFNCYKTKQIFNVSFGK